LPSIVKDDSFFAPIPIAGRAFTFEAHNAQANIWPTTYHVIRVNGRIADYGRCSLFQITPPTKPNMYPIKAVMAMSVTVAARLKDLTT
jgi:hypothetical protein